MKKTDSKKLYRKWLAFAEKHGAATADSSHCAFAFNTPYGRVGTSFYQSDDRGAAPWITFCLLDWESDRVPFPGKWFGWDHWKVNLLIPDRCDFTQAYAAFAFHTSKFFVDKGQGFPVLRHSVV